MNRAQRRAMKARGRGVAREGGGIVPAIQEEIVRLQGEHKVAQQEFVKAMEGMGSIPIDEICAAFRKASMILIEIHELKLRAIGDVVEAVGVGPNLVSALSEFTFPTIG